jgi:dTMP kinase
VTAVSRGIFITLEGGEGAGKSTQARRLADRLRRAGREVVLTREPGGSPGAESLRALLLEGAADRWSPTAETLMMYAARSDHLDRTIRPALSRGAVVICDRFSDSTRAYQGAGGGVAPAFIEQVDAAVVGDDRPDLTLIFDLPVEVGLERAAARGGEARFESKGLAFHQRLREGFLAVAAREPGRCAVLNVTGDIEAVEARVWAAVSGRLPALAGEGGHG